MKKIYNTYNKLIKEEATPQQVEDSIKKRYRVEINYLDDKNTKKGEGRRIIEPVTYGLSKAGNPVIRAFQPFGDTKTKVPHWKMFRLDKIDKWKAYKNTHFDEPPTSQWNAEGKYNPNGDKTMSTVYLSADFSGSQKYQKGEGSFSGLKKHNTELHNSKVENNQFLDLKRNIKNSVMATPEVMARIEQTNKEKAKRLNRQQQSASEMSSIKNFGNSNTQTSEGPITKKDVNVSNDAETNNKPEEQEQKNSLNYSNVGNNGPIYKQKENKVEEPNKETEEEIENTEEKNNEENLNK